ncbi:hypothetical protein [Cronobacter dublinensis]|uniref:hypothetical protein n=1 Tax=Cronobacter dublinensis TaxID=413497 RepID=UPI000CFB44C4|nr:hypothetical protein [Cronobacter dublinensis]
MTAKEAIKHYLLKHTSFTTAQIAEYYGLTMQSVQHAARKLEHGGELIVESRDWRMLTYRLRRKGEGKARNLIFNECRASDAMRRVLCVYGTIAASSIVNIKKYDDTHYSF